MANTGKNIGAIAGNIGGNLLLPGVGGSIGGAIGSGIGGIFDSMSSESDASLPPMVDPQQAAFLSEIDQKRKAINTGTEYGAGMREADQALASTQDAIARSTGGDVGATIAGLNKAQRSYGSNVNQVLAQGERNQNFFTTMADDLVNKVSQRRLELEMANRAQKLAESAQSQQDGFGNLTAGLSKLNIGGGSPGVGTIPAFGNVENAMPSFPAIGKGTDGGASSVIDPTILEQLGATA